MAISMPSWRDLGCGRRCHNTDAGYRAVRPRADGWRPYSAGDDVADLGVHDLAEEYEIDPRGGVMTPHQHFFAEMVFVGETQGFFAEKVIGGEDAHQACRVEHQQQTHAAADQLGAARAIRRG